MVPATDEQLATLTTQCVLPATKVAIDAGAKPAFSVVRVHITCFVNDHVYREFAEAEELARREAAAAAAAEALLNVRF